MMDKPKDMFPAGWDFPALRLGTSGMDGDYRITIRNWKTKAMEVYSAWDGAFVHFVETASTAKAVRAVRKACRQIGGEK